MEQELILIIKINNTRKKGLKKGKKMGVVKTREERSKDSEAQFGRARLLCEIACDEWLLFGRIDGSRLDLWEPGNLPEVDIMTALFLL